MTVGTIVASYNDLTFSAVGYALALMSCLCQAGAFELGRRVAKKGDGGVCTVLHANAVVAIVLQFIVVNVTGEVSYLSLEHITPLVALHLAVNSASCLLMNYTVFLNCSVNSPLAHAVTGNLKAACTTLFGVLFFTAPMTLLGCVGVAANFTGAGWFSWIKLKAKRRHDHQDSHQTVPSMDGHQNGKQGV